ncbi:hypothetical protein [Streptomyces sp. NPDC002550]
MAPWGGEIGGRVAQATAAVATAQDAARHVPRVGVVRRSSADIDLAALIATLAEEAPGVRTVHEMPEPMSTAVTFSAPPLPTTVLPVIGHRGVSRGPAEVLAGFRAIPVLPVPEPSKEPPLPDMLVEGVVEPHLFLTDDDEDRDGETRDGTVASRTTMSWRAAMTVSAMPGCPSRRAVPGFGS